MQLPLLFVRRSGTGHPAHAQPPTSSRPQPKCQRPRLWDLMSILPSATCTHSIPTHRGAGGTTGEPGTRPDRNDTVSCRPPGCRGAPYYLYVSEASRYLGGIKAALRRRALPCRGHRKNAPGGRRRKMQGRAGSAAGRLQHRLSFLNSAELSGLGCGGQRRSSDIVLCDPEPVAVAISSPQPGAGGPVLCAGRTGPGNYRKDNLQWESLL